MPLSFFSTQEDPDHEENRFRRAMTQLGNMPVIGLVIETERAEDGRRRVINWELTDAEEVASIALSLSVFGTGKEQK